MPKSGLLMTGRFVQITKVIITFLWYSNRKILSGYFQEVSITRHYVGSRGI